MVLNERKYAEKALTTYKFDENITTTLFIISKYLHYIKNKADSDIIDDLDDFMKKVYMDYNKVSWLNMFEKTVKSANKYSLIEIDYIPITKAELNIIDNMNSEQEKRVLFSMLCYAKYYNMVNPNNNNWINTETKVYFKTAHVILNVKEQNHMLYSLFQNGYINISNNARTLNKQVNIVDNTSDIILKITDFRDLGYEYLLYKGENYIRCASCGKLTKGNKKGTKKYCIACNKYEAMKTKVKICETCGKEYLILSKNSKSKKCPECQKEFIKAYDRERKKSIPSSTQKLDTLQAP